MGGDCPPRDGLGWHFERRRRLQCHPKRAKFSLTIIKEPLGECRPLNVQTEFVIVLEAKTVITTLVVDECRPVNYDEFT